MRKCLVHTRLPAFLRCGFIAAAAAAWCAVPGAAQQADGADATDRETPPCATGRISYVFIDNHSIFDTSEDLDPRFRWAYGVANALHIRTRESFIETELLFEPGDCYDPFLLEESERLLRGHGFLAQVDVYGIRQDDGSYHVVVDTQDEWSTGVDIRFDLEDRFKFEGVSLKEKNLLGTGQTVRLFFLDRDVRRDYGVIYETPQLLGTRWDLNTAFGRTRPGSFVRGEIAYPFVGETGRWAFRQSFIREDRLFDYILDDGTGEFTDRRVLVPLRDQSFDFAFVRRIGELGRLTMLGGGISYQQLAFPDPLSEIRLSENRDFDNAQPASTELVNAVLPQRNGLENVRLVALFGQRWIRWIQRRGLDAFRGEQDIEIGLWTDVALAKSIPGIAEDDDLTLTFNTYAGFELGPLLVTNRIRADARHDFDSPGGGLQDLFAEGELISYLRPPGLPRHTFVFRARATGGWETETPFQLTLGGNQFLRGHRRERFPGGRRALFSFEDRIFFGWPFKDLMDIGMTAFADVGRVWPGDAPLGIDSGWRGDVGAGLRINFPAGGRTTYRIDLAFPLEGGLEDVRLVITTDEILGLIDLFGDPGVDRSRRPPITANLFRFPER